MTLKEKANEKFFWDTEFYGGCDPGGKVYRLCLPNKQKALANERTDWVTLHWRSMMQIFQLITSQQSTNHIESIIQGCLSTTV